MNEPENHLLMDGYRYLEARKGIFQGEIHEILLRVSLNAA